MWIGSTTLTFQGSAQERREGRSVGMVQCRNVGCQFWVLSARWSDFAPNGSIEATTAESNVKDRQLRSQRGSAAHRTVARHHVEAQEVGPGEREGIFVARRIRMGSRRGATPVLTHKYIVIGYIVCRYMSRLRSLADERNKRRQKTAKRAMNHSDFHVLLALADRERHGYGIMQEAENALGGTVRLRAGRSTRRSNGCWPPV